MSNAIPEAFPLPTRYVDLRAEVAKATGGVYLTSAKYPNGVKLVRRRAQDITGWALHQAALDRLEDPLKYVHVGAHYTITRGGLVLHLNDAEWNGPFANGFNARTISVEMVGRYEGVKGRPSTYWKNPAAPHLGPQEVTEAAVTSLHELARYEHTRLVALGAKMTKFLSHRQSSGARESDPGSEWWQRGALPISKELGYDDGGEGFKIDDGRPNPHEWNPARSERY